MTRMDPQVEPADDELTEENLEAVAGGDEYYYPISSSRAAHGSEVLVRARVSTALHATNARPNGDISMEPESTMTEVSDELTEDQQRVVTGGAACQDRAR